MSGLLAKIGAGVAWAAVWPPGDLLLRVELDDELFLNRETDVLAFRYVVDGPEELVGIHSQPRRDAATAGRFHSLADLFVLAALLADLDRVSLANLVGGDIGLLPVHLDVVVANELPGLGARSGEVERVDDVVQTHLQLPEQVLTRDPLALFGALEVEPELALQQAVDPLDLLLFTKL